MSSHAPEAGEPGKSASSENSSQGVESPKTWKVGTLVYTKFGLISIFTWMLWGDLIFTLTGAVFPQAMPLQLERLKIPQFYVPLLMAWLSTAIALPMNPILSFRSDRYRSRWGRRIPYIFKTMVPLALCLVALGFSDDIGGYLRNAEWIGRLGISPMWASILVMAVLIFAFDFFNMFIGTVYWYLFADVIPTKLMGRFFSLFRVVGLLAGSFFGWFIQQYIETQTKYIYFGAAALYVLGFGLMCWRVKEGEYPPPIDVGSRDAWYIRVKNMAKLYVKECFRHPVHINYYIMSAMVRVSEAGTFGFIFYYRQYLHIPQVQLGHFGAIFNWALLVLAFPTGWLIDKIHPMRATLIAMACIIPLTFTGFFMDSFLFYMFYLIIRSPFMQLIDVAGQPLSMTLFPRKQYGQFASANGTVRSLVQLFSAPAGGWFISSLAEKMGPKADAFAFLWMAVFQSVAFGCMYMTYQYWKKNGAEKFSYDPEAVAAEQAGDANGEPALAAAAARK